MGLSDSSDRIASLLQRAAEKSAQRAKLSVERAAATNPYLSLGRTTSSQFSETLTKALKLFGRQIKTRPRPSIRMTAPDTGGRSFHFEHVTVSKASCAGGTDRGPKTGETADPGRRTSSPAGHVIYIERPQAIEDANHRQTNGIPGGFALSTRAASEMQSYLENEQKTLDRDFPNGTAPIPAPSYSFGTPEIGETLNERIAFWDLVEQHVKGDGSTIQHRLILELPHECSSADRLAIMKRFTEKYDEDRIPFWCVLHAPIPGQNDDRNFHAHIVLASRPAWLIDWEADGFRDGSCKPMGKVWNFAATSPDKLKPRRIRYPERQKIPEAYRRHFVVNERARFASIVNDQMRIAGVPIRYDHRSYKAMGIDEEAMRSVKRGLHQMAESGQRLVLDAGLTKRLAAAEINRIAMERASDFVQVEKVKSAVNLGAYRLTALDREARSLGLRGKMARHTSMVMRRSYMTAAYSFARKREAHLKLEIAGQFEIEALKRCVEACSVAGLAPLRAQLKNDLALARHAESDAAGKDNRKPRQTIDKRQDKPRVYRRASLTQSLFAQFEALPDPSILALIHHEAKAELAHAERSHAEAVNRSRAVMAKALKTWKAVGSTTPAEVPMPDYTEHTARPPQTNQALLPEMNADPKRHLRHYDESAHDMVEGMFDTPQARVALDLTNRICDHIQAAGGLKIKGKTKSDILLDEVNVLANAFAQGASEGLRILAEGPRERTMIAGNRTPSTLDIVRQRQAAYRAAAANAAQSRPRELDDHSGGAVSASPPSFASRPASDPPVAPAEIPIVPPDGDADSGDPNLARKSKRKKARRRVLAAGRNRGFDRS